MTLNFTYNMTENTSLLHGKSAEEIITDYCYDLDQRLVLLLGFMVFMSFLGTFLKSYVKRKYTKKGLIPPPNLVWWTEFVCETTDLFQSVYILVVFCYMILY